jgi:hypothetical protein
MKNDMKAKSFLGAITLMLLVGSLIFAHQSSYRRARKATVFFAIDRSDAPAPGPRNEKYEPYFAKRNAIPDRIN